MFSVYSSLALLFGQRNGNEQMFNLEHNPVGIKSFNSPGFQPWVWMDCVGKSAGAGSLIGNEKPMPAQWKRGNDQIQ